MLTSIVMVLEESPLLAEISGSPVIIECPLPRHRRFKSSLVRQTGYFVSAVVFQGFQIADPDSVPVVTVLMKISLLSFRDAGIVTSMNILPTGTNPNAGA
jgi:hypothetical protein